VLEDILASAFLRVTQAGALAAAPWMGQGDRLGPNRAATEAMRNTLRDIDIAGEVIGGEEARHQTETFHVGEKVGSGRGPAVDIALDAIDGTNLLARGAPNAVSTIAVAEPGGLLRTPDTHMEKLVVGPLAGARVSLNHTTETNLQIIAEVLERKVKDITVIILDRPQNQTLIQEVRDAGARIKLISDGDLAAAIAVAVAGSDVHAAMGVGGAAEGVIAAAALKCLGGTIQGRLAPATPAEAEDAIRMGLKLTKIYRTDELAPGTSIIFSVTGVTDGDILKGPRYFGGGARTHSLVMTYKTGTISFVDTIHVEERRSAGMFRL
jgi:fructose-1,6-bisphosphatase II